MLLKNLLSDLLQIDDILFVIKANGATSEIRSNGLNISEREKFINIGDNDGPCHMHINSELIKHAEFVTEQKPERTSFSVRFYDKNNERVLAGFFTRMYDDKKKIKPDRKQDFDDLCAKYNEKVSF